MKEVAAKLRLRLHLHASHDILLLFFFIDKKDVYIEKRKHQKQCPQGIQGVYKRSQKAQTEGEGIETKNITCLYLDPNLDPNQSMKLTSEEGLNYRHPNPRPKITYKRIFQSLERKLLITKR